MRMLKQSSTGQPLMFLMVDSTDHVTGKTGLSPTVTLSKAGGSFASPAGSVTEVGSGWYKVAGNATDTDTLGPLVLHATGSATDPCDVEFVVVAFDPLAALATPTNITAATGVVLSGVTHTGAVIPTVSAVTGHTPQTGDSFARIGAAGAGLTALGDTRIANLDATISSRSSTANLATVADYLDTEIAAILADTNELQTDWANGGRLDLLLDGAASAGDPWTTTLPGSYSGSQAGKILSDILTDTGTTLQAELDGIQADTEDIQSRLPAALVSGRIDVSVGAMAANVITASALQTDAVSEIADGILSRNASNVEGTAGEHTLCTVILAMLENSISGTTLTIKRTDGSTTHATKTLTVNAAAEPITGIT